MDFDKDSKARLVQPSNDDVHHRPPYDGVYASPSGLPVFVQPSPRRSTLQRFCRIACAILSWVVLNFLIYSAICSIRTTWGESQPNHYHISVATKPTECIQHPGWFDEDEIPESSSIRRSVAILQPDYYDIPADLTLTRCIEGPGWSEEETGPFSSSVTFDLPISSKALFLLSRGQKSGGTVNVLTSPEQAADSASYNIVVHYRRKKMRDLTKVCLVARQEDENGVGIFTPSWPSYPGWAYDLRFETTITLPEVKIGSDPLSIEKFETDVPNTAQFIEDISNKVHFESLFLRGTNGPIEAKSLEATTSAIRTSNSGISGQFNSSNTLFLSTSNGRINVDVGLQSDGTESKSKLVLSTSNSPIQARISLTSATGSGGSSLVTTRTTNGKLDISLPAAPLDSKLDLTATTSNSPATIALNPTYEGTFKLSTSSYSKTQLVQNTVTDPSGKHRKRKINYNNVGRGSLSGSITWDDESPNGSVYITTTNSPIQLLI